MENITGRDVTVGGLVIAWIAISKQMERCEVDNICRRYEHSTVLSSGGWRSIINEQKRRLRLTDNVFIGIEDQEGPINAEIVQTEGEDHYVLLTGSVEHPINVEVLLAHELAHAALRHTRGSWLSSNLAAVLFGVAYILTTNIFLAILAAVLAESLLITPMRQQEEFDADRKAAEIAGPQKVIETLELLKRTEKPLPVVDSIFSNHPPIDERIKRIHDYFSPVLLCEPDA